MDELSGSDLTLLLSRARDGVDGAADKLLPAVYGELRRIAGLHFRGRGASTLQPTALVSEAYLRLFDERQLEWRDRAHFFALASKVMRGVLVDHAREQGARKRGGDRQRVTLNENAAGGGLQLDLLDLNDALAALSELDERQGRIVEMRCFGGLEIAEVAELLGVSARTVDREWQWAKAWLARRLREEAS